MLARVGRPGLAQGMGRAGLLGLAEALLLKEMVRANLHAQSHFAQSSCDDELHTKAGSLST